MVELEFELQAAMLGRLTRKLRPRLGLLIRSLPSPSAPTAHHHAPAKPSVFETYGYPREELNHNYYLHYAPTVPTLTAPPRHAGEGESLIILILPTRQPELKEDLRLAQGCLTCKGRVRP